MSKTHSPCHILVASSRPSRCRLLSVPPSELYLGLQLCWRLWQRMLNAPSQERGRIIETTTRPEEQNIDSLAGIDDIALGQLHAFRYSDDHKADTCQLASLKVLRSLSEKKKLTSPPHRRIHPKPQFAGTSSTVVTMELWC